MIPALIKTRVTEKLETLQIDLSILIISELVGFPMKSFKLSTVSPSSFVSERRTLSQGCCRFSAHLEDHLVN